MLARYAVGVALAVLALIVRALLPLPPGTGIAPLPLLAIVASAWFGGRGPGLVTTFVSVLGVAYYFVPPLHSFGIFPEQRLQFVVFVTAAVALSEFAVSRRAANEALRESEELFRLVAANLHKVLWLQSLHPQKTLYVSPSFERVWRRPSRDLLDNPNMWISGIHPDDRARIAAAYSDWIDEKRPEGYDVEYRLLRPDGTVGWIHDRGVLIRDRGGRAYRACGIAEDVTERKLMEEKLRASEELWRAAFQNNPTMYFMIDRGGTILSVNPFGAEKLGYTVGELAGRPVLEIFHPEDREAVARNCGACIERLGETLRWELRKVCKDGGVIWVRESARAVRGPKDDPLILIACEDITDARQAAETLAEVRAELAHVARVTTMGELAASIAHEINQPLTAIVANANASLRWLAHEPPQMEEARQATERIVSEGRRGGAVIERVRALSRRTPLAREPLSINDAVLEVISLIGAEAQKNKVAIEPALEPGLPKVLGDRVQFQQVLLNLTLNAIESMSTTAEGPRTLVISSGVDQGDRVRIAVADSGAGVDPGSIQRLFEPFFSTKPRGMGMGLVISRSIVESHGGRIWVAPNTPRGTVFFFTLPAAPRMAA